MKEERLSELNSNGNFVPTGLKCEYAKNPIGLDTINPRLSWRVDQYGRGKFQTAYRILASSSRQLLEKDEADLWDSGRVESSSSLNIVYTGSVLESGQKCFWKVKIWDSNGEMSAFSEAASFEVGLLKSDDWKGEWICSPDTKKGVSPIFRKSFTLNKSVVKARAYICGLGYYELSINGRKAGDNVLDPGCTDYTRRALYVTHDIDSYLVSGENVIGVMLGEGWLGNDHQSFMKYVKRNPEWISYPKFLLQVNFEFDDGTSFYIASTPNGDWHVASGPIIENNIFDGETYDARLEKQGWDAPGYVEDDSWKSAAAAEKPTANIVPQLTEPIKVMQDIKPVKLTNPKKGIYVYDLGQNIAGWGRLMVKGPQGSKVTMKYAEILYDNGLVNQEPLRLARAADTYILKGGSEEFYEPRFTYHGFRYIQVEGYPGIPDMESIAGRTVRTSVDVIGSFKCSNPLLDRIQQNIIWTESDNMHSIPTDCPQRDERMGWLNDATVRVEETFYNFNVSKFFAKWEDDIADTQYDNNGAISDTAPFVFGGKAADAVCSSYLLIPWFLYLHYGDKRILDKHYEGMRKWVEYLGSRSEGYIVGYSYYGDWASPISCSKPNGNPCSAITPGELMSTGYYYYNARIMSQIANILGKNDDEKYFDLLAKNISKAFNEKYYNPDTCQYESGSQASNVFPLFLGIAPENDRSKIAQNVAYDVVDKNNYHVTTGNLCTKYIMEILSDEGYVDVAYKLATQTTYPSWGYMIENGATTVWERWENDKGSGMNSHNHPMYCTISAWFYKYLAGINIDPEGPGFGKIIIKPYIPEGLQYVDASVKTIRGTVSSSWKKDGSSFILDVVIPFNTAAKIFVPKFKKKDVPARIYEGFSIVWENGEFVGGSEGIITAEDKGDHIVFEVGSGSYYLRCEG